MVPSIHAAEPPEVDANGNAIGEARASGVNTQVSLPFQLSDSLSYGAVTESPAEADEADKLSKPIGQSDLLTHQRAFSGERGFWAGSFGNFIFARFAMLRSLFFRASPKQTDSRGVSLNCVVLYHKIFEP
jgi:hypothetical protein